jgi:hypothetical protein
MKNKDIEKAVFCNVLNIVNDHAFIRIDLLEKQNIPKDAA